MEELKAWGECQFDVDSQRIIGFDCPGCDNEVIWGSGDSHWHNFVVGFCPGRHPIRKNVVGIIFIKCRFCGKVVYTHIDKLSVEHLKNKGLWPKE